MSNIASRLGSTLASAAGSAIAQKISKSAQQTTIHLDQYSPEAKALVSTAQALADSHKHQQVEPIHLLACIAEQSEMASIFRQLNVAVDVADLNNSIAAQLSRLPKSNGGLAYLSSAMLDLLAQAEKEANANDKVVRLDNLLNALTYQIKGAAGAVLQQYQLEPGVFRPLAKDLRKTALKAITASTNNVGGFTSNLIARARNGEFGPVIGRDLEVRRLLQILSRQTKNNPLLVGESGCGKTSIVRAIAKRLAQGEVPQNLAKMNLVEMEINSLVAGTKNRSEIEERFNTMLSDFKQDDHKVVLVIEGIDTLITQSPLTNISDLFKMMLMREEVQVFGTVTPEGLRKVNEKDSTFIRRFALVTVESPNTDQAIEMLRGVVSRLEDHHHVKISDPAIRQAVTLAKRYVQDKSLPDSALDVLDEASAHKRIEMNGVPDALDHDIQRLSSLKTQRAKLVGDTDYTSLRSLERIDREIIELEPKVHDMRSKLEHRRSALSTRTVLQAELQKAEAELVEAQTLSNFARVGELEHGLLPNLKDKLKMAESFFDQAEIEDTTSNIVGEREVAEVIGEWTGIPVAKMLEDESEKLLKMEDRLACRVVGQDEAVRALSRSVRRGRVGLRDPGKPIGSFLFLGPSGVGKTELAKALAEFLFDDEQAMTRLDMSEFMEKHMAQRLVGSPPGYVDSENGGFLTEAVRKRPYSVLLFDEVEKAHQDVFNLLLQVLDDGRLTDGRGRTANFSNTVVIMTSNIGSKKMLEADPSMYETEGGRGQLKDVLRQELQNFLRPEFMNRLDDIIMFRPLSKVDLRGIVDIQLRSLEKMVAERDLKLDLTEEAKNALVEMSYEPAFGARPLKRSITKNLQDPMAEAMLSNGYKNGNVIRVTVDENGQFVFPPTPKDDV